MISFGCRLFIVTSKQKLSILLSIILLYQGINWNGKQQDQADFGHRRKQKILIRVKLL